MLALGKGYSPDPLFFLDAHAIKKMGLVPETSQSIFVSTSKCHNLVLEVSIHGAVQDHRVRGYQRIGAFR